MPLDYNLRNTAQFLLLGDGTEIVQGAVVAIYPGQRSIRCRLPR